MRIHFTSNMLKDTPMLRLKTGFFTESPEYETIRARSTCKVLVISRSHMKGVGADHPGSASVVLQNLLKKFGDRRSGLFQMQEKISRLSWATDVKVSTTDKADQRDDVDSIRKLIKLHINKQQDVHTNLFCFAASRGDVGTIESMMDQGFDPNSSDCEHYVMSLIFRLIRTFSHASTCMLRIFI